MATSPDSPAADSPLHDLPEDPLLQPGSFIDPAQTVELAKEDPDLATPKPKKPANDGPERPSWLPDDWSMVHKVRESGATAGSIDRYYIPPNGAGRFRSKNEVDYFLRTGSKRKKSESSAEPSESPANGKRKKSKSGSKSDCPMPPAPVKFDFENIPEAMEWKLKDGVKDLWVPYIDDKMVPKSTKQEWDSACQDLASGKV